jgi:hypothetical protein
MHATHVLHAWASQPSAQARSSMHLSYMRTARQSLHDGRVAYLVRLMMILSNLCSTEKETPAAPTVAMEAT